MSRRATQSFMCLRVLSGVPIEVWTQMTEYEQLAANQAFLDAGIARGDRRDYLHWRHERYR